MDEEVIKYFETHPHLKIRGVETEAGIPNGVLLKAIKCERNLPAEYIKPMMDVIQRYGYGTQQQRQMVVYVR